MRRDKVKPMTWFSRLLFATGLTFTTFLFTPSFSQEWGLVREKAKESVLFVRVAIRHRDGSDERIVGSGTGFVISQDGHLVTSAHLIPRELDDREIRIFAQPGPRDNQRWQLDLVRIDYDLDLALFLLPPSRDWQALSVASSSSVPDDARLFVLGFPRGLDLSSADGMVSNRLGRGGRFQTTLPLNHGNSGGPVFDISGRVVGIATGGYDESQLITLVTPSDFLRPLLPFDLSNRSGSSNGQNQVIEEIGDGRLSRENFSFTVDHDEREEFVQVFCVSEGARITKTEVRVGSANGEATKIISVLTLPNRPNCVEFKAYVAGRGIDRFAGITLNYRGRGWLSGELLIHY
jgi:S1-C subfamily serine protease